MFSFYILRQDKMTILNYNDSNVSFEYITSKYEI